MTDGIADPNELAAAVSPAEPTADVVTTRHGMFGLIEMVLFIATVFVVYAYVWRRGGLEWD